MAKKQTVEEVSAVAPQGQPDEVKAEVAPQAISVPVVKTKASIDPAKPTLAECLALANPVLGTNFTEADVYEFKHADVKRYERGPRFVTHSGVKVGVDLKTREVFCEKAEYVKREGVKPFFAYNNYHLQKQ